MAQKIHQTEHIECPKIYRKYVTYLLKVIRKFFLKHNKNFRWHLWDYEKHNFFPFEGL